MVIERFNLLFKQHIPNQLALEAALRKITWLAGKKLFKGVYSDKVHRTLVRREFVRQDFIRKELVSSVHIRITLVLYEFVRNKLISSEHVCTEQGATKLALS